MKRLEIPTDAHRYMTEVLGVSQLIDPETPKKVDKTSAYNKPVCLRRARKPAWIVFADTDSTLAEEQEVLLDKMLDALKLPDSHISVYLVSSQDLDVSEVRNELALYERVLCLGENSHQLITKITKDFKFGAIEKYFRQNIGSSHSLAHLIANAGAKKETWDIMKALRL